MENHQKKYKAIVIGATGAVGTYLVQKLINSSQCIQLTVISRKEIPAHPKLKLEIWKDFSQFQSNESSELIPVFKGHDVMFCCLGAPEKAMFGLLYNHNKYSQMFKTIDYYYVVGAASIAHLACVPQFSVISTPTASPKASFILSKVKWKMQQAVKSIGFKGVSIFQPYHLMKPAKGNESWLKKLIKNSIALTARIIPANQNAMNVEDVASAMKIEFEMRLNDKIEKTAFYKPNEMFELIQENK
jgi:uncharacterized protein YbjT (DUF2867 family)